LRALPVDLQQHVAALLQALLQPGARGAVEIVMYLGPLGELAAFAHGEETLHVDEVVFAAVLFARPRLARGVGNRVHHARVVRQQAADHRGLSGAGGRGNNEQGPGGHAQSVQKMSNPENTTQAAFVLG
jgi:hypothetical protein